MTARRRAIALALGALAAACAREAPRARPGPKVAFEPAPAGDDVPALVASRARELGAEGRRALVYVGATWCEPCRRFHDAATRGELDAALEGTTFVEFDLDRDGERLARGGYRSKLIPLFVVPDAEGRATARRVEGSVKGEAGVAHIMGELLPVLPPRP